jgi:hypothetical protein
MSAISCFHYREEEIVLGFHVNATKMRFVLGFQDSLHELDNLSVRGCNRISYNFMVQWVTCLVCLETLDLSDNDITLLPPKLVCHSTSALKSTQPVNVLSSQY